MDHIVSLLERLNTAHDKNKSRMRGKVRAYLKDQFEEDMDGIHRDFMARIAELMLEYKSDLEAIKQRGLEIRKEAVLNYSERLARIFLNAIEENPKLKPEAWIKKMGWPSERRKDPNMQKADEELKRNLREEDRTREMEAKEDEVNKKAKDILRAYKAEVSKIFEQYRSD